MGDFEIRLRVTGSFRTAAEAAAEIVRIVERRIDQDKAADRKYQQDHSGTGGWGQGPHQIQRIRNET